MVKISLCIQLGVIPFSQLLAMVASILYLQRGLQCFGNHIPRPHTAVQLALFGLFGHGTFCRTMVKISPCIPLGMMVVMMSWGIDRFSCSQPCVYGERLTRNCRVELHELMLTFTLHLRLSTSGARIPSVAMEDLLACRGIASGLCTVFFQNLRDGGGLTPLHDLAV